MQYWIATIIAIIGSCLFLFSITAKKKQTMFIYQTIETLLSIIKNILLGGYEGAIAQLIGLIRNILIMTNTTIKGSEFILPTLNFIMGSFINERGLLGYLPIIATMIYSYVTLSSSSYLTTKLVLLVNIILWIIYQIIIADYITVLINIIALIITGISIYKHKN
jgi:hypothetical protein